MGLIPDRWLTYSAVGARIEGTRFIAFKVPLDKLDVDATRDTQGINVDDKEMINTKIMFERIPTLGLVIDLTNTKKYYDSKNVTDQGIEYKKIFVPGHIVPPAHIFNEFMSTVTDFLRRNAENDKLIGVHCTHGLNRTGLMICAHMIQQCSIDPIDAVSRFESARGYKMERENYLESLKKMTATLQLSNEIHHGNSRTISTQTNQGIWLETKKSSHKRKRQSTDDVIEEVNSIRGTVFVDGSTLISDGSGKYFMQVELKDVRPQRRTQNNATVHNSQRYYAPPASYGRYDHSHSSQAYYANQSRPHQRSNHRPNPNGTYFADNARYSSHCDRRNAGYSQQTFYDDSSDLFRS